MAYVYISDITPPPSPATAAAALENNARTLDATAATMGVNPAAVALRQQADTFRQQAARLRESVVSGAPKRVGNGGMSTAAKIGVVAALAAAAGGAYAYFCPKAKRL